ncbi:hypothetical protein M5K25_016051 [Dendrobium thyrsiflorum]|uniref:Uncharacterized protein n=1 Tax=Dendrobium thyrsiflorum TaxID=117978 RepID=A0ABD0UST5_DENTH
MGKKEQLYWGAKEIFLGAMTRSPSPSKEEGARIPISQSLPSSEEFGSDAERSRQKGKQIWRPKPHRDDEEENEERMKNMGVTSDVASRRSAPNSRDRRRWVQKKTRDDARYDGRHPGESSRGSRLSPTPPKEEVNFDRSPRVEEILLPNQEPEIQWRRRSEIRLLEEKNMKEDMENM